MKALFMAAIAAALMIASTAAEARHHINTAPQQSAQIVDVAAMPAYPIEGYRTARIQSHPSSHSRKIVLASAGNPDDSSSYRRPSLALPMGKSGREEIRPNRHGMVEVQTAYGFKIEVNPIDASKFLKFFELLHDAGYHINPAIVGCYSPGHKPGSNHHIGRACDIQTGWNAGPSFVYHMDKFVQAAGLHNGCSFGDCGHVEAVRGLHNPRPNLAMALAKFQSELAERQDEAKAFAEHAALVLPEIPKEQKVKSESRKRKVASRSHKRHYAHRHHTRIAQG